MSLIIQGSIKKEAFDQIPAAKLIPGKTAVFVPVTIYVNDQNDKFGNNCSIELQQTKEEREAKAPKTYLGNAKVVFVRGDVKTAKELQTNDDF